MTDTQGVKVHKGRGKGTPNKDKKAIQDKLDELGCDPIEGMATIAKECMRDAQLGWDKLIAEIALVRGEDQDQIANIVEGYLKGNLALRNSSFEMAGKMFKELASFAHAKRKAVDVTSDGEKLPFQVFGSTGLPVAGQPDSETDAST